MSRAQLLIVLAAGVGGTASNLVDLAQIWTGRNPWIPGYIYYVGMLIFFGLGATIALIFGETNYRKAFLLGVSLPALIAAAQTQSGRDIQAAEAPKQNALLFQITPGAHAKDFGGGVVQPVQMMYGAGDTSDHTTLKLKPKTDCPKCALWLYDQDGKFLEKQRFPDQGGIHIFLIPEGSSKFGIWNEQINPKIWNLPSNQTDWSYEFQYDRNLWNDFRRGLGNYNIKPHDLSLVPTE